MNAGPPQTGGIANSWHRRSAEGLRPRQTTIRTAPGLRSASTVAPQRPLVARKLTAVRVARIVGVVAHKILNLQKVCRPPGVRALIGQIAGLLLAAGTPAAAGTPRAREAAGTPAADRAAAVARPAGAARSAGQQPSRIAPSGPAGPSVAQSGYARQERTCKTSHRNSGLPKTHLAGASEISALVRTSCAHLASSAPIRRSRFKLRRFPTRLQAAMCSAGPKQDRVRRSHSAQRLSRGFSCSKQRASLASLQRRSPSRPSVASASRADRLAPPGSRRH